MRDLWGRLAIGVLLAELLWLAAGGLNPVAAQGRQTPREHRYINAICYTWGAEISCVPLR